MTANFKTAMEPRLTPITGGALVTVKTKQDLLTYILNSKDSQSGNFLTNATYNGYKCRIRVIEKKFTSAINNEIYINENNLPYTLKFHSALKSNRYVFLIYPDHLINLDDFLKNVHWQKYTCKSILYKFCTLLKYFHKKKLAYGNLDIKNIFIEVGLNADFNIKLANFSELSYDLTPEKESEDIESFQTFLIYLLSNGVSTTWHIETIIKLLPHYRDRYAILDLFNKIESGSIHSFEEIIRHPFLWKDKKIIDFIGRVYNLTNRDYPAIDVNFIGNHDSYVDWHVALHPSVKMDATKTSQKASERNQRNVLKRKDVNVSTLAGLVSYIRNTSGAHLAYSIEARRVLGSPPECINHFLFCLPQFLIDLYNFVIAETRKIFLYRSIDTFGWANEIEETLAEFLPLEFQSRNSRNS